MSIKFFTVVLLLLTLIGSGTMVARVPQYCNNALNMCFNLCQGYFQGDDIYNQIMRNGCRAGCMAGYANCALGA